MGLLNQVVNWFKVILSKLTMGRIGSSENATPKMLNYVSYGLPVQIAQLPQKEILVWMIENNMAKPRYNSSRVAASLYTALYRYLQTDKVFAKYVKENAPSWMPRSEEGSTRDYYEKNEIPNRIAKKSYRDILIWMSKNGKRKPYPGRNSCADELALSQALYRYAKADKAFLNVINQNSPSWFKKSKKYGPTKDPVVSATTPALTLVKTEAPPVILRPKAQQSDHDVDLGVMKIIREGTQTGKPMSITRIAHIMKVDRVVVSRSASRLEKNGLLQEIISKNDSQRVFETLRLTKDGLSLLAG